MSKLGLGLGLSSFRKAGSSSAPSPLLNGLLHYWSFDDTINLATNQLWYSSKVSGSPYLRHRTLSSDDPTNPTNGISGDIVNFGINQGVVGNATFGSIISQQQGAPEERDTNCLFTTANNSTTPVNVAPLGSVFTMNFWAKFDTSQTSDSMIYAKHSRQLGSGGGETSIKTNYSGLLLQFNSTGLLNTATGDPAVIANIDFATLFDNTWRMFSLVCDGEVASFIINANPLIGATDGYNTAAIVDVVDPFSLPININFDETYFVFGGLAGKNSTIDEFGIWNRALTTSELQDLYNSGSGKGHPFN